MWHGVCAATVAGPQHRAVNSSFYSAGSQHSVSTYARLRQAGAAPLREMQQYSRQLAVDICAGHVWYCASKAVVPASCCYLTAHLKGGKSMLPCPDTRSLPNSNRQTLRFLTKNCCQLRGYLYRCQLGQSNWLGCYSCMQYILLTTATEPYIH